MTTDHAQTVYEKYRQEGRQQLLDFLLEKGIVRESMLDGFVARMADTPEDGTWPIIDLPKDLTAWKPKEEK